MEHEKDEFVDLKDGADHSKGMKQSKYYVAYMDILGYKDFFQSHPNDTELFLQTISEAVQETINQIESYKLIKDQSSVDSLEPQIKIFSDNILICTRCKKTNEDNFIPFLRLVKLMANIQLMFINKYHLVVRGSIAKGNFYIDERFVFGQALITAYEMESKEAVYPRIILQKDEVNKILEYINGKDDEKSNMKKKISIDNIKALCAISIGKEKGGSYFANYLPAYNANYINLSKFEISETFTYNTMDDNNEKHNKMPLYNKIKVKEKLLSHQQSIIKKINDECNYNTFDNLENKKLIEAKRAIIDKYIWIIDYHNRACEITQLRNLKIEPKLCINSHLHQLYIEANV